MSRFGDSGKRACCHSFKLVGTHATTSPTSSTWKQAAFLPRLAFGQAPANPPKKKAIASANRDDSARN